jgi:DNA-binding IclR family transcriptional regulator
VIGINSKFPTDGGRGVALELLKSVYHDELTIKEVAGKPKMSRSTASRCVAVIEAEGLIECRLAG